MKRMLRPILVAAAVAVLLLAAGVPTASASKRVLRLPRAGAAIRLTATGAQGEEDLFHAYEPADIRAAYGLDKVGDPQAGTGLLGQGQTIVLVDCYGSPTAAHDLRVFHDKYFSALPGPDFEQVFPLGRPDYKNVAKGNGVSGPAQAYGWSMESTLDIEWAYAVAPLAHIVLVAVPPAENLGVQGLPNIMKAIDGLVVSEPAGTVFSQSFGVSENTFNGAGGVQTARFDKTYRRAIAKGDTVFCSDGDYGTTGFLRAHKGALTTTVEGDWPSGSPYVTSVGGTQLQIGWRWDPISDVPFLADGSPNPGYFDWDAATGLAEVVWNESWGPMATGGGLSMIYPRPSWQDGIAAIVGNHRGYPDLSWNAAVNGGVLVYVSAFPNWSDPGWYAFGGTSASSPQVAAVVALANQRQAMGGHAPIGNLNPLLYQVGGSAAGASAFRDILPTIQGTAASGRLVDNGLFQFNVDGSVSMGPVPGYAVRPGWDATTGWGSPLVPAFIDAITTAKNAAP